MAPILKCIHTHANCLNVPEKDIQYFQNDVIDGSHHASSEKCNQWFCEVRFAEGS